jgi:hypothetical protein
MVTVIVGSWGIDSRLVEWLLIVLLSSPPPVNKIIVVPLGRLQLYGYQQGIREAAVVNVTPLMLVWQPLIAALLQPCTSANKQHCPPSCQ